MCVCVYTYICIYTYICVYNGAFNELQTKKQQKRSRRVNIKAKLTFYSKAFRK